MENSLHIPKPIAVARPRNAHRFEVFSPKLKRRLTFPALRTRSMGAYRDRPSDQHVV